MDARQLRKEVIAPVLDVLGLWSRAAENLLLGTAAVESQLGHYLRQKGGGPALGIYQMEPATHNDLIVNYLDHPKRFALKESVFSWAVSRGLASEMVWNLAYATAMARVHYYRVPEALPNAEDVAGMASYWKAHYNTHLGAGTAAKFVSAYQAMVVG